MAKFPELTKERASWAEESGNPKLSIKSKAC